MPEKPNAKPEASAPEAPAWGYDDKTGPDQWADIDPSFATCSTGSNQSPIDIPSQLVPSDYESIVFDYKPTKLNLINNGQTIQVNYDPGSFLVIDDNRYQLQQFHFHTPGEHHLNGLEFPMEGHLVHRSDDGKLAVVSLMFYGGVINKPKVMAAIINTPTLDAIWQEMPGKGGTVSASATVNVGDLLPVDRHYVTYEGSLTTPPCTEGVRWLVLTTPVVVGPGHLDKFDAFVGQNHRPIQPLNGRVVATGYAREIVPTPT